MVTRLPGLACLVLVLLAGCAEPAAPAPGASSDLGVLAGVVVDAALRPIGGAEVDLVARSLNTTTDAQGQFRFDGLSLGTHALAVRHPRFIETTLTVQVQGASDPLVRVVLEALPDGSPFAVAYAFDGFIFCGMSHFAACAAGNAGLFITCANTGVCLGQNVTPDNFLAFHRLDGPPDHLQSELVWEQTQPLGDGLVMILFASTDEELAGYGGRTQNETVGTSPLLGIVNGTQIRESGLGVNSTYVIGVYGGPYGGSYPCVGDLCFQNVGLVVQQSYRVVSHAFYHYVPPAGWRFTTDGSVPPPS